MRTVSLRMSCALAAVSIVVSIPLSAQTTRPTVAVLNFEFGSIQQWWSGNQGAAGGMGTIEFGSSGFRETILGEATETAVKETASRLIAAKSRLQ